MKRNVSQDILKRMTGGEPLTFSEQSSLIFRLSVPAILAQISNVIMQYIDAAMVGQLGAVGSAAIGLVSSAIWFFGGVCNAAATGFKVRIAHRIGAGDEEGARNTVKVGLTAVSVFGLILMAAGAALSPFLPVWLGGEETVCAQSTAYFLIFCLSIPFFQLNVTCAGMIGCSGNMKLPGIVEIVICVLDVVFNYFFIFPTREVEIFGTHMRVFGAGLGVTGAAIGTALAEVVVSGFLLWYLLFRCGPLRLRRGEKTVFSMPELMVPAKIAAPIAVEQIITCSSYLAFIRIVSPLGTIALAAHNFAITAESLCYMPGYGIAAAATTVIGQSIGARRYDLTKRFGRLSTGLGVLMMTASAVLLYIFAPVLIGIMSPDENIRVIGTEILRIEAFAEPLFAASIVATGVFRGAGDTAVPSALNLISMWAVRIPLAYALSLSAGLKGVWTAMCIELCVRGILFIILLETRFRRRADRVLYIK